MLFIFQPELKTNSTYKHVLNEKNSYIKQISVFLNVRFRNLVTLTDISFKMKRIVVEHTATTPYIDIDPTRGVFKIEGRCIPENPSDFFDKITEWIHEYYTTPQTKTRFDLNLEYVNSGSSKFILSLFRTIKAYYDKGNDLVVNWYYEEDDEALLGLGEHYKSTINIPINLVEFI